MAEGNQEKKPKVKKEEGNSQMASTSELAGKAQNIKKKENQGEDLLSTPLEQEQEKIKIPKVRASKAIYNGIVNILATFNNTIVTITDMSGKTVAWSSAGKCGFRGTKKSTAYVAQLVAQDAARQAMGHGMREVIVKVKGPGTGRESAIRALQAVGLEVTSILDVTPIPHNGCRPKKPRRV
ncbi:30S ribosomal protein S11 [Candidatus Methylacidiphilum fumarolicum]|uniref:Small ribosomal subunit protein uS11 n=2 Tax=Candidatus Methylacidiphilum fumarolicum TaxID=591154 RepID=I0JW08_METFB|nr:30S ribosomal protein S11 [Candidatus Methylacidiphilum fumarolicum]TFE73653.1 30S ribosomal protein S11 [Candidatus Methylacidiphilum fumarolicum]CAI9086060.1 30S ribosomal protein S11 [Candidatus Methylacidiphilum fumarolicum]CCG91427.1 Ribosomal protein S11 [Methylacidiphilum fumariolicum SolV]